MCWGIKEDEDWEIYVGLKINYAILDDVEVMEDARESCGWVKGQIQVTEEWVGGIEMEGAREVGWEAQEGTRMRTGGRWGIGEVVLCALLF